MIGLNLVVGLGGGAACGGGWGAEAKGSGGE